MMEEYDNELKMQSPDGIKDKEGGYGQVNEYADDDGDE